MICLSLALVLVLPAVTWGGRAKTYIPGVLRNLDKEERTSHTGTTVQNDGNRITITENTSSRTHLTYTVEAGGVIYQGLYIYYGGFQHDPSSDFIVNDPVEMRVSKNKMYLKREDGKELKLKIVGRTRVSQPVSTL